MSFLVRRSLVVSDSERAEIETVAGLPEGLRPLIGQSWLEHAALDPSDDGFFAPVELSRITPPGKWDSWGRLGPGGEPPLVLRRSSLAALWGDPWADYLLAAHPDAFFASAGGMWLRPDLWRAGGSPELLSAEWLNATALAISPDGGRAGLVSMLPEAWGVGHTVVTALDLRTGQRRHFGPFEFGVPDLLEWSPTGNELWLGIRGASSLDEVFSLAIDRALLSRTTLPPGVQGLAWSPDGSSLAVTHNPGDTAGVTVLSADRSRYFPVGVCWTPVWIDQAHLAFGAPTGGDEPGDRIAILRLEDGATDELLSSATPAEGFAVDARLSGGRPPAVLREGWWGHLCAEPSLVAEVEDPRSLSPEAQLQVEAELLCLYHDEPELYAAHLS